MTHIQREFERNIMLLGDASIGKTSLIEMMNIKTHNEDIKTTIGIDFKTIMHNYYGQEYKMRVWDTAGAEKHKSITQTFYKRADLIMICFDLTEKKTFLNI